VCQHEICVHNCRWFIGLSFKRQFPFSNWLESFCSNFLDLYRGNERTKEGAWPLDDLSHHTQLQLHTFSMILQLYMNLGTNSWLTHRTDFNFYAFSFRCAKACRTEAELWRGERCWNGIYNQSRIQFTAHSKEFSHVSPVFLYSAQTTSDWQLVCDPPSSIGCDEKESSYRTSTKNASVAITFRGGYILVLLWFFQ